MIYSSPCVVSEKGRRRTNQDRACVERLTVLGQSGWLMAVADGMGGMQDGDRAAQIAIETVREYAREVFPSVQPSPVTLSHTLWRLFQEANHRIWSSGSTTGSSGEMGTTLVCCLLLGGAYLVANAGDSRCYLVTDADVMLLTEDHSRVQEMMMQGLLTAEEAKKSPFRNELTNCLGEPSEVRVDLFPDPARFGVMEDPFVVILSSDGLHNCVTHDDILHCLRSTSSVADASSRLVALALANGSQDNVTLAAIEYGRLRTRAAVLPNYPRGDITVRGPVPLRSVGRRLSRLTARRVMVPMLIGLVLTATAVVWLRAEPGRVMAFLSATAVRWIGSDRGGVKREATPGGADVLIADQVAASPAGRVTGSDTVTPNDLGQNTKPVAPGNEGLDVPMSHGPDDLRTSVPAVVRDTGEKPARYPESGQPAGARTGEELADSRLWNADLCWASAENGMTTFTWVSPDGVESAATYALLVVPEPKSLTSGGWPQDSVLRGDRAEEWQPGTSRSQRIAPSKTVWVQLLARTPAGRFHSTVTEIGARSSRSCVR